MIIQGVTLKGINIYDSSFNSNGALLYLDPGNTSSYSGSGTTWTDLSGNNNNATLNGSPTFTNAGSASYFTFNGAGTQNATTLSSKYVQTYTGKTVMMVIRPSSSAWTNGAAQFRGIFGTAAGARNFNTYIYHDASNNIAIHYSANGLGGFSNNITLPSNQWSVVAVTQTTGGLVTYYLNGVAVGTNTSVTFAQYANSGNSENVAYTDNWWYGDVGVTAVYGRALSADEIVQNYNSLATRYGMVTSNLVAYYNPDLTTSYPGTGTTLYDISGNGLNGTMSNLAYTDPYLTYNGTSSQVSIADNALLEPGSGSFTVEAWVYYTTITGSTRTVLAKTDNGGTSAVWSYGIRTLANGSTYLDVGNGTTNVNSPTYTVTTGTWYQIVGVWTNGGTKTAGLYINGVSQGTTTHTFTSVKNSVNPLYLGSYNGGEYAQWFSGREGIVRYYNTALTAAQVLQNYNANRSTYGL